MEKGCLRCIRCSKEYPCGIYHKCELCGGILDFSPFNEGNAVGHNLRGLWKYWEMLPLSDIRNIIYLGEGETPLLLSETMKSNLKIGQLYFKCEHQNPTGSFKDRGLAVAVSMAKELRVSEIVVSSSGNAAASAAAYAAKAKIRCSVFIPATTSSKKTAQAKACGADVVTVSGTFSDAYIAALNKSERYGIFNVTSTFLNPYNLEGVKTIAFEIFEQLNTVPDHVLLPISAGPLLVGIHKGFGELLKLGLVKKIPKLTCIQAAACSPIVKAFESKSDEVEEWLEPFRTIAQGISDPLIGYKEDGTRTLKSIRETKGTALALSESQIVEAAKILARDEGIFAEPTGAVSVGGLFALTESGFISKNDIVVCVITGHGLKQQGVV